MFQGHVNEDPFEEKEVKSSENDDDHGNGHGHGEATENKDSNGNHSDTENVTVFDTRKSILNIYLIFIVA